MLTSASRRLPGVRFEPRPAPLPEILPRMDVAVFVGFAAHGPIDTAVAVESASQFEAVFGSDAALAWDPEAGEMVTTLLAPAVRAFFANGGQRCWAVRVAGDDAGWNHFPLAGVLAASIGADGVPNALAPAFMRGASRGCWSDGWRVATALRRRPLTLVAPYRGGNTLALAEGSPLPVVGDTVRIIFAENGSEGGSIVVARVSQVGAAADTSPPGGPGASASLILADPLRLSPVQPLLSPLGVLVDGAWIYRERVEGVPADPLPDPGDAGGVHPFQANVPAEIDLSDTDAADAAPGTLSLILRVAPDRAPALGTLARLRWDGQDAWLTVESLGLRTIDGRQAVRVRGRAWHVQPLAAAPIVGSASAATATVELVSLDVRAFDGVGGFHTATALGLAAGHPAYANQLRTDEAFFHDDNAVSDVAAGDAAPSAGPEARPSGVRFPLAGAYAGTPFLLPLDVPVAFGPPVGAVHQSQPPLERDGLANFSSELFLDAALVDASVERFAAQSDFIRYLGEAPRRLRGMHAALGDQSSTVQEEATLIAVPDAVHRGWSQIPMPALPRASALGFIPRPDWWPALVCAGAPEIPAVEAPERAAFLACDIRAVTPPTLVVSDGPDASGTYTLAWESAEADGRSFLVEESALNDFAETRTAYQGSGDHITFYGRSAGDYYYRARVFIGRNASHWSLPLALRVGPTARALVRPVADFDAEPLVAVHRAMLRMAAGRGDLFAVLALPRHYREREAVAHADRLRTTGDAPPGLAVEGSAPAVAPLRADELPALSYGAVYHPWPIARRADGVLVGLPPDGAALGVMAARARQQGAWLAPANQPMPDIIALTPAIRPEAWLDLQTAQVNIFRQEPRGFLSLGADTLYPERDLRPINVRRLLILLRRLALRRGAAYVFEPLSDSLRRLVRRGFEEVLFGLYQRGAFAGATPEASYQVITDPPQSRQDAEVGRMVAEIKVAPSLPLTFLSLRLVQSGERLAVVEGA
jgi:hypothetical protein